jgi:hypothetical protein
MNTLQKLKTVGKKNCDLKTHKRAVTKPLPGGINACLAMCVD